MKKPPRFEGKLSESRRRADTSIRLVHHRPGPCLAELGHPAVQGGPADPEDLGHLGHRVFSPIIFRACFNFAGLNRALSASYCNAAVCSAVDTLA